MSPQSTQGYEDAVRQALQRAAHDPQHPLHLVNEFEAVVENDHAAQFRVNVEISFLLDEEVDAGSDVFLRAAHGTGPDAAAPRSGG